MIGFFDSGSGGLTVLSAFRKRAPDADVIYFGDIANAPYGEKSAQELIELTHKGVRILQDNGATALVSACNSVSASVLEGAAGVMPFIEMSRPTSQCLSRYRGQRFLLIATPATIASGLYENAMRGIVSLDSLPIAGLGSAIEFEHSEIEIKNILNRAFSSRKSEKYDGLILACTHYPLAQRIIEDVAFGHFGKLRIIDPAVPVAKTVCETFDISGSGEIHFLVSQKSEAFKRRIENFFPKSYSLEAIN